MDKDKEKNKDNAAEAETEQTDNSADSGIDPEEKDLSDEGTEDTQQTEEAADTEAAADEKAEDKTAKELAEQKDKYLRLMAEYDNYRKRTAKEQLETRQTAIGDTVLEFIKIYDNFERAAETECSDEKYKTGVEMILKQFKDALDKLGVKIIDPTGESFDPATANAVSQIEDPELGDNVVAQVFEKGVMIGDKVIRYPMVVVANP